MLEPRYICVPLYILGASLIVQWAKNLRAMQETWVQSEGQEDPLEKGMAARSSTLGWRLPRMEEPGGLQSLWAQESGLTERLTHHQILWSSALGRH